MPANTTDAEASLLDEHGTPVPGGTQPLPSAADQGVPWLLQLALLPGGVRAHSHGHAMRDSLVADVRTLRSTFGVGMHVTGSSPRAFSNHTAPTSSNEIPGSNAVIHQVAPASA
jgi:hypothetical protein